MLNLAKGNSFDFIFECLIDVLLLRKNAHIQGGLLSSLKPKIQ